MTPPPTTAIMLCGLSCLAALADEASEELACPLARRTEHDLARRPGMDDPATVHEHDPVGDVECEADLMGRDKHGHALGAEFAHHLQYLLGGLRVECRSGLVEEQGDRPQRQCPRYRDALLLPAGQPGRQFEGLSASPTRASNSTERATASWRSARATRSSGSATFSAAVRCWNKLRLWKTMPTRAAATGPGAPGADCGRPWTPPRRRPRRPPRWVPPAG